MNEDIYIRVNWPEVQSLMDEPWFRNEAILDTRENAPSSSYLIPKKRVVGSHFIAIAKHDAEVAKDKNLDFKAGDENEN